MMLSQCTKAHGEKFICGEKMFGRCVGSYVKSPSAKPRTQVRDRLEPITEQGQQVVMKRDFMDATGIYSTQVVNQVS